MDNSAEEGIIGMENKKRRKKVVGLCTAKTWVRVIGWIQVIGSTLLILIFSLALNKPNYVTQEYLLVQKTLNDPTITVETKSGGLGIIKSILEAKHELNLEQLKITRATMIVAIVAAAVNILMGLLLLFATYERNTIILWIWIIYALIGLIYFVVFKIIGLVFAPDLGNILLTFCIMLVSLFVQALCIKCVFLFKSECDKIKKEEQRQLSFEQLDESQLQDRQEKPRTEGSSTETKPSAPGPSSDAEEVLM